MFKFQMIYVFLQRKELMSFGNICPVFVFGHPVNINSLVGFKSDYVKDGYAVIVVNGMPPGGSIDLFLPSASVYSGV